ncbi:unnamed protein product [Protopolystoma xenopodis]|uniref:Uncharacterized protein n=1 Tax=Protopolystoma xenopodis TaxID=117903 RepID=A0A448XDT4_9PLAT|nr:unnamed protein product [Protopolystoma xenopodis]
MPTSPRGSDGLDWPVFKVKGQTGCCAQTHKSVVSPRGGVYCRPVGMTPFHLDHRSMVRFPALSGPTPKSECPAPAGVSRKIGF